MENYFTSSVEGNDHEMSRVHLTGLSFLCDERCLSVLCYTVLAIVCIIRAVVFYIS